MMIVTGHSQRAIGRQCEPISISRASFYRRPAGETPEKLELMGIIDDAWMEAPGMARARSRGICVTRACRHCPVVIRGFLGSISCQDRERSVAAIAELTNSGDFHGMSWIADPR